MKLTTAAWLTDWRPLQLISVFCGPGHVERTRGAIGEPGRYALNAGRAASNKALKLTKPAKVRAPRHSASLRGAPCRSARSSLMWASQLNAVLYALGSDGRRSESVYLLVVPGQQGFGIRERDAPRT